MKTRTQELEDLNRALFSMMEDLDERTAALEKSQDELRSFTAELEESRNRATSCGSHRVVTIRQMPKSDS